MSNPLERSRTKIVATLGPACSQVDQIAALVEAGVSVLRLNAAHSGVPQLQELLNRVREVSRRQARPLAVLLDLAGPKIRLGELPLGQLECQDGAQVHFVRGEQNDAPDEMTTTYEQLLDDLKQDDRVLLADGTVILQVEKVAAARVSCRVTQGGIVRSRQGVNLPGVKLSTPALTDEDRQAADWAATAGVDYVGLSFVRRADEIHELKKLLRDADAHARVVAKIEKPEALENLEAIVRAADGVMVARGDLGVEIDVARVAVEQKRIITLCNTWHKPVIVATQMLDSMQHSLQPTRAESTDVANAILDGADACMLSGETAVGEHPRQAVAMMQRIAKATESLMRERPPRLASTSEYTLHPVTRAVVLGANEVLRRLDARLAVVASHSGATAVALSNLRNVVPIVGVSDQQHTVQQMNLFWGVTPLMDAPLGDPAELLHFVEKWGLECGFLRPGDRMVVLQGARPGLEFHNTLSVYEVL